jgi:ATP-dependent Lhr-like helicase
MARRVLDIRTANELGALDPEAIARVREEAWPQPQDAEEVHETLLWIGHITVEEGRAWRAWLEELAAAGRAVREGDRWYAAEASRDPKVVLRGRLEALGPVFSDDPLLLELEAEGSVMRTRIDGRQAWCNRRLLARIQRYTLDRLRREIEPVTAAEFLRFLAAWQHADPLDRLEGPGGVAEVVRQLAGFEVPAALWEASVLPARIHGYQRQWLDQVTLSGEVVWLRLWASTALSLRRTPIALVRREDLEPWLALSSLAGARAAEPEGTVREVAEALARRGASFFPELLRATALPPQYLEANLADLVVQGRATCDSFGGLRWLMVASGRRRAPENAAGRWSVLPAGIPATAAPAEFVVRQLLRRTGVVFRKTLARERQPIPWRDLARTCRLMEARGELRGGRFVAGFDGEQYALPEAITLLRAVRKRAPSGATPVSVSAADPLNFQGILTPEERVSPLAARLVKVG